MMWDFHWISGQKGWECLPDWHAWGYRKLKEVSEYFPFPEHRKCLTSLYQKMSFNLVAVGEDLNCVSEMAHLCPSLLQLIK